MNVQVTSRVAERLKAGNLMKLRNFEEIRDILAIVGKVLSWPRKKQILIVQKIILETFCRKGYVS